MFARKVEKRNMSLKIDMFSIDCCLGYRCGNLEAPNHGNIYEHNVTVGSTATFACSSGYRLVGNSTATCQSNSVWSSTTPTCESNVEIVSSSLSV